MRSLGFNWDLPKNRKGATSRASHARAWAGESLAFLCLVQYKLQLIFQGSVQVTLLPAHPILYILCTPVQLGLGGSSDHIPSTTATPWLCEKRCGHHLPCLPNHHAVALP